MPKPNERPEERIGEALVSAEHNPVGAGARRLEAPSFYAATAQVLISGNDATLLFARPHPAILPNGTLAPVPMRETVALVQMSIAGVKDLALMLTDVVSRIEQKTGEIPSELTLQSGLGSRATNKRRSNGH
jgi:hypothetical protein